MDSSYLIGCFLEASSVSKGLGSLLRISLIFPLMRSSVEMPPPPISRGSKVRMVSQMLLVSMIADEMAALL